MSATREAVAAGPTGAGGESRLLSHFRQVGTHNRKYFVLFVCYSAIFCLVGTAHSMYELTHALPMRQVASRPHGSIYTVALWGIGVPQLAHSAPLACVVTVPRSPDLCPNAHKGQQPFTWLPSRPTSWIVAPYGGLSGFSLAVVVAFFEGAHGRIEWFVRVVQRACQASRANRDPTTSSHPVLSNANPSRPDPPRPAPPCATLLSHLSQVDGPGCGYALALLVSTVINLLAALVLSGFACFHIGMILKNR